jgi:gliding motility-associated-like protein
MRYLYFLIGLFLFEEVNSQNPCAGLPVINITASAVSVCRGESITLTATGGNNYSWNHGVGNGQSFIPTASGVFTVTVIDANGCTGISSISIEVKPLPVIQIENNPGFICLGDSILLQANGAVTYQWINPNIPNNTYYQPSTTGEKIFTVEGIGANGCRNTAQTNVLVKAIPQSPSVLQDSILSCQFEKFNDVIVANSTNGNTFWFKDQSLTNPNNIGDTLKPQNEISGKIYYYSTNYIAGCHSIPVKVLAEVIELPLVNAGSDLFLTAGEIAQFNGTAASGITTVWNPSIDVETSNSPTSRLVATDNRKYTLLATDQYGCKNQDEMTVTISNKLIISNILTPNNDGDNDFWKIYPSTYLRDTEVKVYDAFGRLVFETSNYLNNWDGTFEGKPLPHGDYYYHVKNAEINERGTLIIVK